MSLCTTITRQPIELESCSDHLKMRDVFWFRFFLNWKFLGFCFFVGDIMLVGVHISSWNHWALNTKSELFDSSFYWKLGYNASLYNLWFAIEHFWFKSFGQKNKILTKQTKFNFLSKFCFSGHNFHQTIALCCLVWMLLVTGFQKYFPFTTTCKLHLDFKNYCVELRN